MSWLEYLDTQLIGTGDVNEACLLGLTDCNVWASTPAFLPRIYKAEIAQDDGSSKEEVVNEASILLHIAHELKKPPQGFRVNGVKYMPLRTYPKGSEDDGVATIYFKKGKKGGCLCVLNQSILIGTYDETKGQASPTCNFAVEALARYLYSNGY
eukprot:snap_masked-scaffold_38-processed-gene-2.76-mRNA-1 protein AED:0.01 eAED:0.01 QI:0/-1/0/1/-1/1/1/0/153